MKSYGKLENGKLTYAPRNYETEDGAIINFNIDEEAMKKYGFKEIKDNQPEVEENQHIEFKNYMEDETTITINYKVVENKIDDSICVNPIEERIISMENTNVAQDDLINTTMMATDEMFSLIEPLLGEVMTLVKSDSKITDLYVAMIKRNLKTIDKVPLRYKEAIEKHLK